MMLRTIFSVCLPIQSPRRVVSCVIAPEAMVLPSITSNGTGVDFLITKDVVLDDKCLVDERRGGAGVHQS